VSEESLFLDLFYVVVSEKGYFALKYDECTKIWQQIIHGGASSYEGFPAALSKKKKTDLCQSVIYRHQLLKGISRNAPTSGNRTAVILSTNCA
jgi:hypothetical protein